MRSLNVCSTLLALATLSLASPLSNTYLPPQANAYGGSSSSYSAASGFAASNSFVSHPAPSRQYLAPAIASFGVSSAHNTYAAPATRHGPASYGKGYASAQSAAPSIQYLAPAASVSSASYSAPAHSHYSAAPAVAYAGSYSAPSASYSGGFSKPSLQYLAPAAGGVSHASYSAPARSHYSAPAASYAGSYSHSGSYAAPAVATHARSYSAPVAYSHSYSAPARAYSAPSRQYLAPAAASGASHGSYTAPARTHYLAPAPATYSTSYSSPARSYSPFGGSDSSFGGVSSAPAYRLGYSTASSSGSYSNAGYGTRYGSNGGYEYRH